jgi:hypothetical protein
MRVMIFVAALAVVLTGPIDVGAQTSGSVNATPTPGRLMPAPVGHRQPTAQSVQKAQAERGGDQRDQSNSRAPSVNLDKGLTICRGC